MDGVCEADHIDRCQKGQECLRITEGVCLCVCKGGGGGGACLPVCVRACLQDVHPPRLRSPAGPLVQSRWRGCIEASSYRSSFRGAPPPPLHNKTHTTTTPCAHQPGLWCKDHEAVDANHEHGDCREDCLGAHSQEGGPPSCCSSCLLGCKRYPHGA